MDLNKTLIVHVLINNERKDTWNSMYQKNIKLMDYFGYSNKHLIEYTAQISNNLPINYYKTLERAESLASFDKSLLSQYEYFMVLDLDAFIIGYPYSLQRKLNDFNDPALMFFNDSELQEQKFMNMSFGIYSSSFFSSLINALETEFQLINSMSFNQYMVTEFLPRNNEIIRKVNQRLNKFDQLFFKYIFEKYNLTGIRSLDELGNNISSKFLNAHLTKKYWLRVNFKNKNNQEKKEQTINENINNAFLIHFLNNVDSEEALVDDFMKNKILKRKKFKGL